MNDIEVITKYATKAIDAIIVAESKTQMFFEGDKWFQLDFSETGYVKLASLLLDGLGDYKRVGESQGANTYSHYINGTAQGYQIGDLSFTWEIYKLRYDRGKQFLIDAVSNEQTAGLVIANTASEFTRTKVVPEIDEVRFSTIASRCNTALGNLVTETIGADEIISKFNKGFAWLSEREVPDTDQVIFVNPQVMELILNTQEIKKYLTQDDYKVGDNTFRLNKYMGRYIIEVPSSRFFTNVVVDASNGYYAGANSYQINYMIVSLKAVYPIVKFEKLRIFSPEVNQRSDSWVVNYRLFHDIIIPKNKIVACYTSVSSTLGSVYSNRLDVSLVEGNVTNAYQVDAYFTTPAGKLGRLVTKQTAMAVGSTQTPDSSTIKLVSLNTDIVEASATTAYFALIDNNNIVVATTPNAVTLPKKAE